MALNNAVSIVVTAADKAATAALDDLKVRLDELARKTATASVDVNDKKAKLQIDQVTLKLADLSKKVASPRIDVAGALRAQIEIDKLDASLDRLDRKTNTLGFFKRTSTWAGLFQMLRGNAGSAGAGGAGGAAAAGAGAAAGGFFSNPYLVTGGITAALTALPFIAQAAGGGIVSGLGTGLAGMGALAASKSQGVRKAFASMSSSIGNDMRYNIGKPLVPVLENIMQVATRVFHNMAGTFHDAMQLMAPA